MTFDDPNRANVYYVLARAYRWMGKYQHAIEYFRRAKLLQKRSSSHSCYVYANTLADLAVTFSQLNDTTKALSLHEQAVTLFRRILGANHIDMPLYYTQLAYVYWQEKRYENAHTLLLAALSILKEDLTSNFAGLGLTKHTMGLVKYAMGQREEAVRFLQEALEMRRKSYADDHPHVARAYYDLALIYMETGNEQVALEYAQAALTIYQAKVPKTHTELKRSLDLVERLSCQREYMLPYSNFGSVNQ
ncbi:unnamed protein product [Rotaria sp. Silwood2]|nr:unnamed protein product [Rotaria sp. Silwood2]CAF4542018.1 unnamed protein product [Rotaria sp. Silwood2]